MFGPIAAGIGQIDSIRIVDMGGDGKGVTKMAGVVPDVVFQTLAQLKAKGVDVGGILKMFGVNLDGFESLLEGIGPAVTGAAAPKPANETKSAHS